MAARKEPSHVFAPYFDVFPDNLGRERLHFIKTEDLGRGRVHGDVDGRQGRRRRFVIGAAGRRGLVRQGGRRARGRDGRRVLEYHHE